MIQLAEQLIAGVDIRTERGLSWEDLNFSSTQFPETGSPESLLYYYSLPPNPHWNFSAEASEAGAIPTLSSQSIEPLLDKLFDRFAEIINCAHSLEARKEWLSRHIKHQIAWQIDRSLITPDSAQSLLENFATKEPEPYLIDFANQVALTLPVSLITTPIATSMWVSGTMPMTLAFLADRAIGAVIRTAYTINRIYQSRKEGLESIPHYALWFGILLSPIPIPFIADGAYLVEQFAHGKEDAQVGSLLLFNPLVKALYFVGAKTASKKLAEWAICDNKGERFRDIIRTFHRFA